MPIDEVFRYVVPRAPRDPRRVVAIRMPQDITPFLRALLATPTEPDRTRARSLAGGFLADAAVRDVAALPLHRELSRLEAALDEAGDLDQDGLESAVLDAFDRPATAVVADIGFRELRHHLIDGVVALKITSAGRPGLLAGYARLLRLVHLVDQVAAVDDELRGLSLQELLRAPIVLPDELIPGAASDPGPAAAPPGASVPDHVGVLQARLAHLAGGLDQLLRLGSGDLAVPGAEPEPAAPVGELDPPGGPVIAPRSPARGLRVAPHAVPRLSSSTLALLSELQLDPADRGFTTLLDGLEEERAAVSRELRRSEVAAVPPFATAVAGHQASAGAVEIAGRLRPYIGDLELVGQHLLRYEAADIAHVENVLRTESRSRDNRRLRRTEEQFLVETERTEESEQDLKKQERSEMQRMVKTTLQESQQTKMGATMSAGYGPYVQVTASVEHQTSSSFEESTTAATTFAREVTERTALKITERVREQRTTTTIEEFEETNHHGFDNTDGAEHVVGIYQWLVKVLQEQRFNWGTRMLFTVAVPRPAEFLRNALENQLTGGEGLTPPAPLDIEPRDLDFENYQRYVRAYRAGGVLPPPPAYVTLAKVLKHEPTTEPAPGDVVGGEELQIPAGYRAVSAYVRPFVIHHTPGPKAIFPRGVTVQVGKVSFPFVAQDGHGSDAQGKGHLEFSLDDEVGSIPVAVGGQTVEAYAVVVEITCLRTVNSLHRWRQETYDTLVGAHDHREAEYRDQLASVAAQRGFVPEGRNPAENRRIERLELQRLITAFFLGNHLEDVGTFLSGPFATFDFDDARAEGRLARFWTEALDWPNLTYELLAYFWGPRSRWVPSVLEDEPDPQHRAFLSAGQALATIAVMPGYERAVLHALETGELWDGGDLPPVVLGRHAAVLAEIERRPIETAAAADPVPVDEPWTIHLPTDLVRVKPTATLPAWEEVDGEWRPVPEA